MKLFRIIKVAFVLIVILGGCKKDEKFGQVTFSGSSSSSICNDLFTVTINGKTGTFPASKTAPICGIINNESFTLTLPVGTYTFTFDDVATSWINGSISEYTFNGQKTVNITDGGCVSVRWE